MCNAARPESRNAETSEAMFSSKATIIGVALAAVAIFVAIVGPMAAQQLSAVAGYHAKMSCSGIFVSKYSEQRVDEDLPGILSLPSRVIDYDSQVVHASVLGGLITRTAVFRGPLGCTLLIKKTLSEIRSEDETLLPALSEELQEMEHPADPLPVASESFLHTSGIDLDRLDQTIERATSEYFGSENRQNTRAIVVVYKGQIIRSAYGEGISEDTRLRGWSMSKSVLNALIGIREMQGKLNRQEPGLSWADNDCLDSNDVRRKDVTVDSMLRMSSGLEFDEVYSVWHVCDPVRMLTLESSTADFAVCRAARVPASAWPGSNKQLYYASGTSNMLSAALKWSFDEGDDTDNELSYLAFPHRELFHHIGAKSFVLETDEENTMVLSSYVSATALDWTKLGMVYLNEGSWDGSQLIAKDWIQYSVTQTTAVPAPPKSGHETVHGYGAHVLLNTDGHAYPNLPHDMAYFHGFEQQIVAWFPSKDLLITRLGATFERANFDENSFLENVYHSFPAK